MMLDRDHWQEIWASLAKNRSRTLLTAFGVFWGIFLLVIMLGSGNGLRNGIVAGFGADATNSFFLWGRRTAEPYRGLPPNRDVRLALADVAALKAAVPELATIAPRAQAGGFGTGFNVTRTTPAGTRAGGFNVNGDVPEMLEVSTFRIVGGRFLNPLDLAERRKVAVVGRRVQEVLFAPGEPAVGGSIEIRGVAYRVVGVFASPRSGDAAERDEQTVFVPLTTFQAAFNTGDQVDWLAVRVADGASAEAAEEKVRALLAQRHQVAPTDRRAFGSFNLAREFGRVRMLFSGIGLLVWLVGSGTLAAGVIGVSNILLILVKERTKELGLRRAVGATPFAIGRQIVAEAVVLTAGAGYLGLVAGVGVLEGVRWALDRAAAAGAELVFRAPGVSFGDALTALSILVLGGTLAGLVPAQRAVSVPPVVALRAE